MHGKNVIILYPLILSLQNRDGDSRGGGLKPDAEENYGLGRVVLGDFEGVHGGVNHAHIGTVGFSLLQAGTATGDFEHITKGGDNYIRDLSQGDCFIEVGVSGNTNRATGAGYHFNCLWQNLTYTILKNGYGMTAAELHKTHRCFGLAVDLMD